MYSILHLHYTLLLLIPPSILKCRIFFSLFTLHFATINKKLYKISNDKIFNLLYNLLLLILKTFMKIGGTVSHLHYTLLLLILQNKEKKCLQLLDLHYTLLLLIPKTGLLSSSVASVFTLHFATINTMWMKNMTWPYSNIYITLCYY